MFVRQTVTTTRAGVVDPLSDNRPRSRRRCRLLFAGSWKLKCHHDSCRRHSNVTNARILSKELVETGALRAEAVNIAVITELPLVRGIICPLIGTDQFHTGESDAKRDAYYHTRCKLR